jgi:prepilin-type N-terminal cleavage/methylation domain-containing protein
MSRERVHGFALVEILCALIILGVGLIGMTRAITLALRSSKDSEQQTAAALLAAGRLETLRAEGYITEGEDEGDFGEDFPQYAWRETVEETATEGLYRVIVTVELGDTEDRIYELETVLFDVPFTSTLGTSIPGAGTEGLTPYYPGTTYGRGLRR